jgi:hypothetical protein
VSKITVKFETTREKFSSMIGCPVQILESTSVVDCDDYGTCIECLESFIDRITVTEATE